MSNVGRFRAAAIAGLVATALVVTPTSAFGQAANQPAKSSTASTLTARNNVTAPVTAETTKTSMPVTRTPLHDAIDYSGKGVALFFIVGKGDTKDYRPDLTKLLADLKATNTPAKVFGMQSNNPQTYLHYIVNGVTHTGYDVGIIGRDNPGGYTVTDIHNGRVAKEATGSFIAYRAVMSANVPADRTATVAAVTPP